MNAVTVRIGAHLVRLAVASPRLLPVFRTYRATAEPDAATEPDLTVVVEHGYGVPFRDYDVQAERSAAGLRFTRADYSIETDAGLRAAVVRAHDTLALKHAMMNLYSAFIVRRQWGLMLHASCAVDRGRAHLFAGHSGAGKSTAARLSMPRAILGDEACLVRTGSGPPRIFDSPFRSELEQPSPILSAPLGSTQLLRQAEAARRAPVAAPDALLRLMDKVFYWPCDAADAGAVFPLLRELVRGAPVYELHFRKNRYFWELIS